MMYVYQQRYARRRKAILIGFIAASAVLMAVAYWQSQTFYPIFLLVILLPLLVLMRMQRIPPLRFNHQGMAWGYELYDGKMLPRLGFLYWHDIASLTWQVHDKGGCMLVCFPRGALRTNFPKPNNVLPPKQHGKMIEVELLLYMLDTDHQAVFAKMQEYWQQACATATMDRDDGQD